MCARNQPQKAGRGNILFRRQQCVCVCVCVCVCDRRGEKNKEKYAYFDLFFPPFLLALASDALALLSFQKLSIPLPALCEETAEAERYRNMLLSFSPPEPGKRAEVMIML